MAIGRTPAVLLADAYPELVAELVDPAQADGIGTGSGKKLLWQCQNAPHTYEADPHHRCRPVKPTGCPYCSGYALLPGFNDLETVRPDLAKEALFDASAVAVAARKKQQWRCALGHEYEMATHKRSGKQAQGCPYCVNKRVLPGFNDLATTHPELTKEALFDPTTVVAGHSGRKPWKCRDCGHEWQSTVNSRTSSGVGCSSCASHGFDSSKPAWLYLIPADFGGVEVSQYGITNSPKTRMKAHKRSGFRVDEAQWIGPADGAEILELETSIKRALRERSVATASDRGYVFSGSTEAFLCSDLNFRTLAELLAVIEREVLAA